MAIPSGGSLNSSWILPNGVPAGRRHPHAGRSAGGILTGVSPRILALGPWARGTSRHGDSQFLGGNQMPVGEGLHHVFGRHGRLDDLAPCDRRAAFQVQG